MSAERFDTSSPELGPDPIALAVEQMDQAQQAFFVSMSRWVRTPSEKHEEVAAARSSALTKSLHDTFFTITSFEGMDPSEKANASAALIKGVDATRVSHYQKLAPKVRFETDPSPQQYLADKYLRLFDAGEEPFVISQQLIDYYKKNFTLDTKRLIKYVNTTHRAKTRQLLSAAGKETLKIGRLSLAFAVGFAAVEGVKRLNR